MDRSHVVSKIAKDPESAGITVNVPSGYHTEFDPATLTFSIKGPGEFSVSIDVDALLSYLAVEFGLKAALSKAFKSFVSMFKKPKKDTVNA